MPATWKALYESQAMSVWVLVLAPALFLAALASRGFAIGPGVEPYAARWVRGWAIAFAVASIVDPIATGPLGWPLPPFVLLGDYRLFALVLVVMQPGRPRASALAEGAAWTLVVPFIAGLTYRTLEVLRGPQPEVVLWVVYEIAFALLVVFVIGRVVPARVGLERFAVRRYVRAVLAYVGLYYVLWASADLLVMAGREWGWGLRIVPNLLYYGGFVPLACLAFFAAPSAASSTSTQAAR